MFNLNNAIKNLKFTDDFNVDDYLTKLKSLNISKRSLIVIIIKNRPEYILFYIYCIVSGYVVILLNDTEIEELESILTIYNPNYIFSSISNSLKGEIILSNQGIELKKYSDDKISISEDLALLLSTSGSTNSKKFVRISYGNLLSNAKAIKQALDLKNTDVAITNLPLNYSFGLSILNSHLIAESSIVITDYSILQKEFWQLINKHQITSLYGVPYTFEILDKLRFFEMKSNPIIRLAQAGGKMNPKLLEKFVFNAIEKGINYFTMYGQTEATARISYLPSENALSKLGSIGVPIPGGIFELRDENDAVITSTNTQGELVYYGENVSMGYATCVQDLIKEDENKGKLYTGDIGYKDQDGYYYLIGRKNRFVKIFGNRVSLSDIEEKLHLKGIDAVCGGVDDKLVIYLTDSNQLENVKTWVVSLTKLHTSVFDIRYIDKIPRNASGKIIYFELFK